MPVAGPRRVCLFLGATLLAAQCGDETVAGYGAADRVWRLSELDRQPAGGSITLTFPEAGRIAGQGPCNRYSAAMTAPYPWFEATALVSTERACPERAAEARYLDALAGMTQSEVSGDILILTDDTGREMVFTAGG